ncbi:MAG: hypothetical protein ACOYNC_16535 [Bacteroidales bacterium]
MKENKTPDSLNRRDFFKKAAKLSLPFVAVLGLGVTLSNCKKPDNTTCDGCANDCSGASTSSGCSGCSGSCSGTCSGSCTGSSTGGCSGCSGKCSGACGGTCTAYCGYTCLSGK